MDDTSVVISPVA